MLNQASRAIFDYWINIRRDRAAPLRGEIDPVSLRHLLPHLFIVARDGSGTLAYRLAGTRICDLFDRELRGQAFAESWLDLGFRQPVDIAENVVGLERPAYLKVRIDSLEKRHAYEMLLLPVRPMEGETSDRVLGALLPQASLFPLIHPPIAGLVLTDWTFLTGDDAHFGVPLTADRRLSRPFSQSLSSRPSM